MTKGIRLSSGAKMPVLGLGTWAMGERARTRSAEIAALQLGIDLGIRLIDTAEMYGDGGAEEVVGEAIAGRRDEVFLVSKVYPHHATRRGVVAACERSLKRLGTGYLDLYLLHWRGKVPLAQTIAGFETLRSEGRVRAWGVSNFDASDIDELLSVPGGAHCAVNQVLYHLNCRGIEWDVLPLCRRRQIAVMAYSPLGQGKLLRQRALREIASRLDVSAARVALAWLLARQGVSAIPKAANADHVRECVAATKLTLPYQTMRELDQAFPPASGPAPLQMI